MFIAFRKSVLWLLILSVVGCARAIAQDNALTEQQLAQIEKAFELGNKFMEQKKYSDALAQYKVALAIVPDQPNILYNGGLAAYISNDYSTAVDLWKRLKAVDPLDWQVRAKLIQAYQALDKKGERDVERTQLFDMWKSGKPEELKKQVQFCREQFQVNGKKVMAFEHFELKGERALRYVFSVLNETEDGEDFRISLGSYNMTNAIWRESTKPTPKEGERLFHLDGYFKGGHATYGFYTPEPSYDDVRGKVVQILLGKNTPISSTTVQPPPPKTNPD